MTSRPSGITSSGHLDQLERDNKALRKENLALKRLATYDQLTELLNRHGLAERLDPLLRMVELPGEHIEHPRKNAPHSFAIVMIDIDYFKRINDTYGHEAGDRILQQFASRIQVHVRASDVYGRWGGEEFMLGLIGVSEEDVERVVQKLHESIRSQTFMVWPDGELTELTLTASFGIAFARPGETIEELKDRADKAMYQSKDTGRDTITIHDPERPTETA